MKTTIPALALALTVAASAIASAHAEGPLPFSRSASVFVRDIELGINIGNTLDCPGGETEWGNRPITRGLIQLYKGKGINAVRVPVTWRRQFDRDDANHTISTVFLDRVQDVVDLCVSEGMVTILDIHHDGGSAGWPEEWLTIDGVNEDRANAILADVWRQIAMRFRDYGEKLVFEAFNEIRKAQSHPGEDGQQAGQDDWGGKPLYCQTVNRYAKTFYDTVRATGGNNARRYLLIPTYAATDNEAMCREWRHPNPSDNHVIASIHAYLPGWFCLWGEETRFDREKFTECLDGFFGTLKRVFIDKGVPVIIGEVNAERRFHGGDKSLPNDSDRVKWAKLYSYLARTNGCACFIWEQGGSDGMGLIDRANLTWTHPEIIDAFHAGRKFADAQARKRKKQSS